MLALYKIDVFQIIVLSIYATVAGPPPMPPEIPPGDINSTSVRVTWNKPRDANGVITRYTVNVRALDLQTFVRRRRQVDGNDFDNCVTGKEVQNLTFPGNTTEARLQNLSKLQCTILNYFSIIRHVSVSDYNNIILPFSAAFAQYEFSVQAETMAGPGNFSPPQNFSTTESSELPCVSSITT